MAAGTRSSKRKRTATLNEEGEPSNKHQDVTEEEPPVEAEKPRKPTGHPFIEGEVEWKFVRVSLVGHPKKVIPAGYEGLAGEVNDVLKTLTIPQADKVRKSCMGQYTRLDNCSTRSGNMLHYVVSHQVTPEPNFDPTSLFFKIGRKVLRFSRMEYALVSGLNFGPSNFQPYTDHELPPDSTFKRLFGENQSTRLCDVRAAYTTNKFKVNGVELRATSEDLVKLSKLILCIGFAMGFDGSKKKIPLWMWVLLENEREWEEFPWGSISYQVLLEAINGIPVKARNKNRLNYTFKGNTIAFSAWIFEAIPTFGEMVGLKKEERQIPRFMRYSYAKERGYPTEDQITKRLVRKLKPHTDEKVESFWKSLEYDPAPHPFAFKYDPTDSMKRKNKEGDEDEAMEEVVATGGARLTTAQLDAVVDAAIERSLHRMKKMLKEYHTSLLGDVAEKVANLLLQRATQEQSYGGAGDAQDTVGSLDAMADTQQTVPCTPPGPSQPAVDGSIPATTNVVAVEETMSKLMGSVGEEPSMFSLGLDFNDSPIKAAEDAATVEASELKPTQEQPSETHGTKPEASPSTSSAAAEGQGIPQLEDDITDSQIDRAFDNLEEPPIAAQQVPLYVRPLRIVYPSRACRSPFLRDDIQPRPDQFDEFIKRGKDTRNVGLPEFVDRHFFMQIKKENGILMEDHVNSYLAVLASNPTLAGFQNLDPRIGITCCFFMCEIEYVFQKLHRKNNDIVTSMFNYYSFDRNVEEVVPEDLMARLVLFADGTYPVWGDHVKEWTEFEKVVAVCYFDGHWATIVIDMLKQQLIIHDPKSFQFQEDDRVQRLHTFLPMARLVPQLMKRIGYFQRHNIANPKYGQWPIVFGPQTGRDAFRDKSKHDAALYFLRYVEKFVARGAESPHTLRNKDEVKAYRTHVAKTIFSNSTDPTSIPMMLDAIGAM